MKPTTRFVELPANAPWDQMRLSPVLAEVVARTSALDQENAVLIRHQVPYVLLGPQDRRLPALESGIAWLTERGLPVFMRIGGGSAVLLDETCLSFAVTRPCRDFTAWELNFREMSQGVVDGLRHLGIDAGFGRAEGSYCEGPYDLVAGGQKIAGIAQAIRGGFALVSGMLLVRQDPVMTTELLQHFYRIAGSTIQLRPDAVTSLNVLDGQQDLTVDHVRDALYHGFSLHHDLKPTPFTTEEWETARELHTLRQLRANEEETNYASRD